MKTRASIFYFCYTTILVVLIVLTTNCNTITSNTKGKAFLGGEIINPKSNWVVIYNTKTKALDSLKLNAENRFFYNIENLHTNLYSIMHGGEYQMLVLEPNDSIMLRLNTLGFDESLVFTGKGAKKNNYLIKTFLANETQSKQLIEHAIMEPEAFSAFTEKNRKQRLDEFYKFLKQNKASSFFKSIIEANINYNAYADKEIYPFAYFGSNKMVHLKDLPKDFYNYRKTIAYNNEDLSHFFSYNRFLDSHIDNLAVHKFYTSKPFHSAFSRQDLSYNLAKLRLIDSLITNTSIKNNLLKNKTLEYISSNPTDNEITEITKLYTQKSTNAEDKTYVNNLVRALQQLKSGNPLPNVEIVDSNNNSYSLNTMISKPTVIHFWSNHLKAHYKSSSKYVKKLKQKFNNINFIAVNIDDANNQSLLKNKPKTSTKIYRFKNPETGLQALAVNYINKAIIINANGTIAHPNTNIYNKDFESFLTALLNE